MNHKAKVSKQVQRTRKWVVEALLLLLEKQSYEEINITDITNKAGIARQTFYRNYKSKDDIIITYLDDMFEEFKSMPMEQTNSSRSASYISPFRLFMEHREALIKLKNAGLDFLIFNQLWSYNDFFLQYVYKNEHDSNKLYNEYLIKFQIGGLLNIILEWIKNDMPLEPEKIGQIVYEIGTVFKGQAGYLPDILSRIEK